MNKFTRLTALLLALMMIFSTFAAAETSYKVGEMTQEQWQQIVENAQTIVGTPVIDEGGVAVRPEYNQPTTGGAPEGKQYLVTSTADLSGGSVNATLYTSGQLVITGAGDDQWQINVGGVWVNITGAAGATLTVTNAMVQGLGTTVQVRQANTPDNVATIAMEDYQATMTLVAAVRAAETETTEEEVAPTADPGVMTIEEANQYTVTISYTFGDGSMAASAYTASLGKGTPFSVDVANPVVTGYVATVDTTKLQDGVTYNSETGVVSIDVAAMSQNINVYVVYQPGLVKYTINHYWQNVDNDQYTLHATTTGTGTTGTKVPEDEIAEEYEGFYNLLYAQPEIAADGSTTVEIYYDRYYSLMNFDLGGGYGVEPIYARYGTPIVVNGTPTRAGYTFVGWATTQENADAGNDDATIPATMPAEHVTYYAVWKPVDVTQISIVFWGENADDEAYSYITTKTLNIEPGESFTFSPDNVGDLICPLEEGHVHSDACGLTCSEDEHTHDADCYRLTCTIELHTHTNDCYGDCDHTAHSTDCYSVSSGRIQQTTAPNTSYGTLTDLGNGIYTYTYRDGRQWVTRYYVKIGDYWYNSSSQNATITYNCNHVHDDGCLSCAKTVHTHTDYQGSCYELNCDLPVHIHTGNCYSCGKVDHTHTTECYVQDADLDSDLWTFVRSETVTAEADGSTVVNVYYDRTTFTLTFEADGDEVATITDKWGAYIADEFNKAPFNTTYNGRAWECTESSKYDYALQTLDRMPKFDATFELYNKSSNTLKTIYYYVENVGANVSETTWPTSTTNFTLLKEVDTYFNYATYEEEYHLIEGFTRYSASVAGFSGNQKNFSNNTLYLYYLRNSYNLNFNNGEEIIKTDNVEYQASLAGYADYNLTADDAPSFYEPGSVEFGGWYLNPECSADAKVEFTDALTMPAGDIILYAKWSPKTYTVRFFLTEDLMKTGLDANVYVPELMVEGEDGTLTPVVVGPAHFKDVPHGTVISQDYVDAHLDYDAMIAADPRNPYDFVAWFYYDENGEKKAFDPTMQIRQNLDLFAEWTSDFLVSYTIKYVWVTTDDEGNEVEIEIAAPTTGSALGGDSETFVAKGGEELYAGYQEGYFPTTESHNITFTEEDENGDPVTEYTYTFYYTSVDEVPYTVYYVTDTLPTDATLAALGTVKLNDTTYYLVHETKKVSENRMAVVTENFEPVTGYMPDAFQKRLVITNDGNAANDVIVFYYTIDTEHAYYRVTHYLQNLDGTSWTEYTSSQIIGDIGMTDYEDAPMTISGYTYSHTYYVVDGMVITVPEGGYKLTSAGLQINLYYTRNLYPYVVHYYLQGTTTELADDKLVKDQMYDQLINEAAIEIEGYDAVAPTTKSITIAIEDGTTAETITKNVIIFYYTEKQVTINYVPSPAAGGTVSLGSETIGMKTGVAKGSTATANEHYTFKGWYDNKDGTGTALSTEATFVPKQPDTGLWESVTYYAVFEENTATINYIPVGPDNQVLTGDQLTTIGSVAPTTETVKIVTGSAKGSTATPVTPTYKFDGWYSNAACTNKVSADLTYVPAKPGEVWPATTTYYAKFVYDVGHLAITKTVVNDTGFPATKDTFTFTVTLANATSALPASVSYSINGGTAQTATLTNGQFTLTLENGETATISNLLNGTTYTVTETAEAGFTTTVSGNASGSIIPGDTVEVEFTNTYKVGGMTVTKTVVGDTAPADSFNFTLNLTGVTNVTIGVNGTNTVLTDGTYNFTLTKDQTITFTGIPAGVQYTVAETADPDYNTTKSNDTGTIKAGETAEAKFENTYLLGDLIITKTVTGDKAPADTVFTFTVTLSDTTINKTYSGVAFVNGVGTVTLKAGDSITIEDLPGGITYKVTEAYALGYTATSEGAEGGIVAGKAATAAFTNAYAVGTLAITKAVVGDTAPADDEFTFTVTLTDANDKVMSGNVQYSIDGDTATTATLDGTGQFTLSLTKGQKATIVDLPAGAKYKVEEAAKDGYDTAYDANDSGTITTAGASTTVTNTYLLGDLIITKNVVNNTGFTPAVSEFDFTVTLTGLTGGVKYYIGTTEYTATLVDNAFTVKLTDGQTVTIKDLPDGTAYTVVETAVDGYTTTKTGDSGSIQKGTTQAAVFTNTYAVGSLTISKTVTGAAAPVDASFVFTVTLPAGTFQYTQNDEQKSIVNGGTVTLTDGESVTITGIPAGTTYTVVETVDADQYATTVNGTAGTTATGTITANVEAKAEFVNAYQFADLSVTKIVEVDPGVTAPKGVTFTITVLLKDAEDKALTGSYTYTVVDGDTGATEQSGTVTLVNGLATFSQLDHNDKITIEDIPLGTKYTVEEIDIPAGFAVTYTPDYQGTLGENGASVTVTNGYPRCSLTIEKTVSGGSDDTDDTFIFHVSGPNGYSCYVTLKAGGSINLDNLAPGEYTITETSWSYRYTPDEATKTITLTEAATTRATTGTVVFTNTAKEDQWLHDEASVHNEFTSTTTTVDGN